MRKLLFILLTVLISCKQPADTGQWVEQHIDKITYEYLLNNGWILEEVIVEEPDFKRYTFSYSKDTMPTELNYTLENGNTHLGLYFVSKTEGWTLWLWDNGRNTTDSVKQYYR